MFNKTMAVIKPELLAPAGDLEKLKIAVTYGADAVYLGGKNYGLRAKSKNFDDGQMKEGVSFAHERGAKVYVTANIFAHNADLDGLPEYFKWLEDLKIDGILVSDPGIFRIAQKVLKHTDIHISTQANNTNYESAMFWRELGAKRLVLARELTFAEIAETRRALPEDFQLEAFVHGAMCISYSGRCLLSNYMTHRDANKGQCSHPCRFNYHLVEEKRPGEYYPVYEDEGGTYIFNSKDLCMIHRLDDLIPLGLHSLKIEGRMKTAYYVGAVVKAYREAIDDYFADPELYRSKVEYYLEQLKKTSHRDFTTGFYDGRPDQNEHNYLSSSYVRSWDFVGMVKSYDPQEKIALVEQRNKFSVGDKIEFFTAKGSGFPQIITQLFDVNGNPIESAPHAQQLIRIKTDQPVAPFDMLRKEDDSSC